MEEKKITTSLSVWDIFFVDPKDTTQDHLVFKRIVSLKDSFAKKAQAK